MPKTYELIFGSGNSANFSGLSPTFTIFNAGATLPVTPPSITELPAGSGMYAFVYGPTLPIFFKADGGSSLADSDRFRYGSLDPIQSTDEKIGTLTDSIGSTLTDPSTLMGFAMRNQEFDQGNAVYNKSTNVWSVYGRGSSTLLFTKTLTNTAASSSKS